MTRGVVLLALNHAYYGNFALNLCASIKYSSPNIKVCLLHDGKGIAHLTEQKLRLFDDLVFVDEKYYTNKGRKDYLKAKTYVYNLSPYDETIFIDADVIWLPRKPISQLFDRFADIPFTMANRGCCDLKDAKNGFIIWSNPEEIRAKYPDLNGSLYNLSSEFMYFKKDKEVKKLFEKAQKNYETLKVHYVLFGNDIPDELPFSLAMMQTGIYPHQQPFLPFYWEQFMHLNIKYSDMLDQYFAYSCGGAIQSAKAIKTYNNLAQFYCNSFGFGTSFPMRSKRSFLPERVHI